uniref:Akirin-2 n=1 Tax=Nothobranchius furzeri TaxID=105023 RepID=A0A8C6P3C9_NOTFU
MLTLSHIPPSFHKHVPVLPFVFLPKEVPQHGALTFGQSSSRLSAEQILNSIKRGYKHIHKRKHLDGGIQQSECCYSPESSSQPSTMNVSSMPRTSSGGVSPTRKEQPLFTLRQVGMICERLLKEREEKVREEYEETMTSKLAEHYDTFVKFTHDQLMR